MKTLTKTTVFLILLTFILTLVTQVGRGQTLIISEVADPGDVYQARFVEFYNATGSSIDLSAGNWYLSRQSNGSSWADIALTGTISSGGTYIVAYSTSDFNSAYGFNPDQSSGFISGNGDDGYFLYSGGDHSTGTLVDIYGVIDEDGTGNPWEYTDSHAVRNSSVCSANTTWTASEWTITSANVADMTPGTHTCDCPGSGNDNDSQVSASSTLTEPATISSLTTSSNGLQVFDFTFTDLGTADGVATIIDQLQITQGSANGVADWTNTIAGAVLNGPDVTNLAGTVNATNITFSGSGIISIADNTNETYTLSIWLKTDLSAVNDNDILEFAVNYSNITIDASGSSFGSGAPESGDTNIAIDIVATELRFAQQPTDANINNCMSPDVSVEATDVNGNRDLDFTESIRITSTGSMASTPLDVTAVSGIASFSGANCVDHTVTGNNLTLNAERTNTLDWDIISNTFNITDINACGLEEFSNGTTAPAGWTFTNIGGTYTTATNYGNNPPSLKMDATGDIIETATVTSPSQLSFWIKGQTTDASSALLVEGWDGSWNTIENIVPLPTTGTTKTYNTGLSSYSKFRFTYTKSAGNLAFDDVDVTCGNCAEPTNDASALTFPSKSSVSINLSWTSGNGGNRIVVCREGAAVSFTPADNNTYTANTDYSAGTEVGTAGEGNKVIYNGSASTTTVTGLTPGTTYYFKIFEYGCSGGAEDYYISGTPAEGNETTLPENVSDFTLTCITNTTATLTWTIPTGGFDGILIAVRESTLAPSDPNCDGIWLTSASTDFSTATTYCGNTTDSRYVYNATGTSVTITGLTSGADYVFKAFTYNGSDWTNGTQTAKVAAVSNVTNETVSPTNQQLTVSWMNPVTCYDEILVVVHKGGSVTGGPADGNDGSTYSADSSEPFSGTDLGTNDFVVYKGTETNFDATGLSNGTQYCFKIFTRKGTEWSSGVEICGTPADVTVFNPGELIIIGFDSNVDAGKDSIFLTSLVDIKPGTEFLYVNSRYEAGAPANVRTAEWHGGGDDPNADPGIFKISYSSTAASNIAAGSIISFSTTGYKADYIKVDGVLNTDFTSTNIVGSANIHATDGDQIWLLQGSFTDQGTYYTLDGNVLWGLTNNIDWVPIDQPVSDASDGTGRESRLNPDLECFNLSMPTGKGFALYLNSSDHNNSKRNLLLAIMNGGNWADGTGDGTMNFNADFTSPYQADSIGKPFTITAGGSTDGTWLGGASGYVNDWFSCMNWEGLTVPDSTVDVTIPNTTDKPIIDHTSGKAAKYSYIAECNNITIDNNILTIEGSVSDTLFVHGNLTIQNSGTLDMNSGGTNDGLVYLSGNWDNQATFDAGKGTVVFNGANSQTITTSATSETFNNLRINNSNLLGVTTNNNLLINDTLSQNNSLLNLKGKNIQLNGVYENTNSFFEGDAASDFTISADADNGNIDSIYFKNDINVNNFSIDRTGKSAVLMTDLFVNGNLTVTSGNVTFTSGQNYDIAGSLINTLGTPDALIVKSDASGTASLIQNTGNVPATVERYLSGNNWHYIFTPLTQVDTATFTVAPWGDINPNVYWYNEPTADFWSGLTVYNPTGWSNVNTGNNSGKLYTDRGYVNYFTADKIYTQTGGLLNDADKTFTLSYTDNGTGPEPNTGTDWDNFEGWNLLGNPYVSAVDWDNAGLDKTYIENFVYYWDDASSQYKCYGGNPPWDNSGVSVNGGTQFIPAGQGFFVKALSTGNGQSFTIPKSARVHSGQTFWKSESNPENLIKLQIKKDNYTDETIIRTLPENSGVTENHDPEFDAYKMFSWDETKPQLYSLNDDNSFFYVVNSLPEIATSKIIPLGTVIGESGFYEIQMTENYFTNMHIWLEDRTENKNINLLTEPNYGFTQSVEINNNRFYLHFSENTKPILNSEISDQIIPVNINYTYTIPENIFKDNDFQDVLNLSATLENSDNLPDWLSFDTETQTFSGTPSEIQTLKIKVTATDIFGASVSDTYKLTADNSEAIRNYKKEFITVYPNPAKGKLTVSISNTVDDGEISIIDITGKIVLKSELNNNYKIININNLKKGVYIVEIVFKNQIYRQRLIKE